MLTDDNAVLWKIYRKNSAESGLQGTKKESLKQENSHQAVFL